LDCLKGIFLLLDELEKHDQTLSKTVVLRYLLAIRALIDALPRNFFLMVAITPEAKRRYFEMVPAFQGRLQNMVLLKPLTKEQEALDVFHFYLKQARDHARHERPSGKSGNNPILTDSEVKHHYSELLESSRARGLEGVTHRDFLNSMHDIAESIFQKSRRTKS
jgi:hypothetical protein